MKHQFVITENVRRGASALLELEENVRLSPGRGLAIIDGITGTGKTEFVKWYVTHNRQAVKLRSLDSWTVQHMLEDISLALFGDYLKTKKATLRRLIEQLQKRPQMIIVDEGDRILTKDRLLENIRDLHDLTNSPIVLVSEGKGKEMVARKERRFWRRVGKLVEFENLSVADVQVLGKELAALDIPRAGAEEIHLAARGGVFGEVMLRLEDLESKVKANPGKKVDDNIVQMALDSRKMAVGS